MSRQADPTLIGTFVLGALALAVAATLLLAGGGWFGAKGQHVLYFEGAAQGLQIGAPVMFLGVKVGTVKQIQPGLDNHDGREQHFVVPVTVEVLPHVVRTRGGEQVALRDRATVLDDTRKALLVAQATAALRAVAAQESPTVQQANAALREIARAADALRKLAETLERQPDAIYRGKRPK